MKRGIMLRQGKIVTCLAFGSAFIFAGLSLSFPVSATPAADPSSSATATVHVSEACSLTSTLIAPHTDNMGNGTYTDSLGSTKFTVKCNDASGFALYAIGYSGDEYGATSMLGDNELSIPTGTDASAGNTTSHWSMKIEKYDLSYHPNNLTIENGFGSQHLIPSTYTKIASFPSSTDGVNGVGTSILATYGVRISGTQAAGTYIGKVKYTLVHPNMNDNSNKPAEPLNPTLCLANKICYVPNASDIIGSMDSISNTKITSSPTAGVQSVSANSTAQLIAPNYSRPGYGFAGWSTDFEATSSSTIYGPNETISTNPNDTDGLNVATTDGGAILYPVWIASAGDLQGWSCSNSNLTQAPASGRATLASMTALKDTRDNNVYAVAKLADGKCWMTENLRLNNKATITTANTQSNNGSFGGVFTSLPQSVDLNWGSNTSNNLYTGLTSYTLPQLNTNNTNIGGKNASGTDLSTSHNTNTNSVQWYSYGNYYSWAAAIADTTAHDRNNEIVTSTSICPTGWRLPIGGQSTVNTTGDFYILTKTLMDGTEPNNPNSGYSYYQGTVDGVDLGATASSSLRNYPNNFIYSGYWGGSSAYYRGSSGYYWSSSANDSNYAYRLYFSSSTVRPGTNGVNKYYGFPVRCVAGGSGS